MEIKTRQAGKGSWLTQSELEDESSRLFVKQVAGFGDLNELYTLWSDKQKEEWELTHPLDSGVEV